MIPFGDANVSLADRRLLFGESLYEVLPMCGGEPRFVDEHHEHMQAAARELGLLEGAPKRDDWIAIGRAPPHLRHESRWAQAFAGGSAMP